MRHGEISGEPANPSGQESDASRVRRFLTRFEEQLEAEADAKDRPSCSGNLLHRVGEPRGAECTGPLSEIAHSRDEHPVRPADIVRVSGELSRMATGSQRSNYTGQIIHAIVDYDDHSVPLVEGTPVTRGSWLVAPSSARAKALKAASTM